jgi:hypothetical protein
MPRKRSLTTMRLPFARLRPNRRAPIALTTLLAALFVGIVTLGRPGSGWAAVTDETNTTDDSPGLMTVTKV